MDLGRGARPDGGRVRPDGGLVDDDTGLEPRHLLSRHVSRGISHGFELLFAVLRHVVDPAVVGLEHRCRSSCRLPPGRAAGRRSPRTGLPAALHCWSAPRPRAGLRCVELPRCITRLEVLRPLGAAHRVAVLELVARASHLLNHPLVGDARRELGLLGRRREVF